MRGNIYGDGCAREEKEMTASSTTWHYQMQMLMIKMIIGH